MRYYTNNTKPLNTIRRTLNKDTYVPESIFHLMPLCKSTKRHQVFYAALYLQRQGNQPIMQKNNPKHKLLSRLLHICLEQPCLSGCNLIKKLMESQYIMLLYLKHQNYRNSGCKKETCNYYKIP